MAALPSRPESIWRLSVFCHLKTERRRKSYLRLLKNATLQLDGTVGGARRSRGSAWDIAGKLETSLWAREPGLPTVDSSSLLITHRSLWIILPDPQQTVWQPWPLSGDKIPESRAAVSIRTLLAASSSIRFHSGCICASPGSDMVRVNYTSRMLCQWKNSKQQICHFTSWLYTAIRRVFNTSRPVGVTICWLLGWQS